MNEQNIKHADTVLKYAENHPFIGCIIDQNKIDRTAFYKYFMERIKQLRPNHSSATQT